MFIDFFFRLRERRVPVSITEWMTLMEALNRGLVPDLKTFYYLARSILIKDEAYFDHYDLVFGEYFRGITDFGSFLEMLREELAELDHLTDGLDPSISPDRVLATRQSDQEKQLPVPRRGEDTEEGGSRSAIQIATERHFKNLRRDLTLDVRQFQVALKQLRQLNRQGPPEELDLERTIDLTSRNAGELELAWRPSRKNSVKLLLLLDVGGSMAPFSRLCSRLFSAANSSTHFKDFKYYYFHNCIYDKLFEDMERKKTIPTPQILSTLGPDYKVILVGDACMATEELVKRHGAINMAEKNEIPGIVWLRRIAHHFPQAVWLNPEDPKYWDHPTIRMIRRIFPMFPLTLAGLNEAIKTLGKKPIYRL